MEGKWYFHKWFDKNHKKMILLMVLIALLGFMAFSFFFGYNALAVSEYPEEEYRELEKAYQPYVYEGVGIDLVGLKKAVPSLKDPLFINRTVQLTYGSFTTSLTVTLDENFNTISVERSSNSEEEYFRKTIFSNILFIIIITFYLFVAEYLIAFFLCICSYAHQGIDKLILAIKSKANH